MQYPAIDRLINIDVLAQLVWEVLTEQSLMKQWLLDKEVDVITDWTVGSHILIKGDLHGIKFENNGIVLEYKTFNLLKYSHLSSLSQLPDLPESYCHIEFNLTTTGQQTRLHLTISNFPTETIRQHMELYWAATLNVIKRVAENRHLAS